MTTPTNNGHADEVLSAAVQQVVQQSRILARHVTRHEEWIAEARQQTDEAIENARISLEQAYQAALTTANAQAEAAKEDLLAQFASAAATIQEEATNNLAQLQESHHQQASKIQADGAALLESLRSEISAARKQFAAERERMQSDYEDATRTQRRTLNQEHSEALENSLETTRRERQEQRDEYQQVRQQTISDLNTDLANALQTSSENYQSAMADTTTSLNAEHQRSNDAAISGINTAWTKFTRILIGATCVSSAIAVAALVLTLL